MVIKLTCMGDNKPDFHFHFHFPCLLTVSHPLAHNAMNRKS